MLEDGIRREKMEKRSEEEEEEGARVAESLRSPRGNICQPGIPYT